MYLLPKCIKNLSLLFDSPINIRVAHTIIRRMGIICKEGMGELFRVPQSISRNAICNVLPLPNRAQLSQTRTLTKYGEVDVHFHGLHAHDVGNLASVAGLVVLRTGCERIHVLAEAWASPMGRRDLLVVPVPDNFRLRISAA